MVKCDICKKPTESIAAKMFFTPQTTIKSKSEKSRHTNYTKHLDVGVCCVDRVVTAFDWHDRMTAAEYAAVRSKSARGGRSAPPMEAKQTEGV